jgi:hypothetical protein
MKYRIKYLGLGKGFVRWPQKENARVPLNIGELNESTFA